MSCPKEFILAMLPLPRRCASRWSMHPAARLVKRRLVLTSAIVSALITGATVSADVDGRQWIKLPAPMQQHMLGNMRDHLQAINEIQEALGKGAYDRAANIAEMRIGVSSLDAHGAAHMAPYMPKAMQDIGTRMHKAASQFARTAEKAAVTGDMRQSVAALAKVTEQCVACHAAFRTH